MITWYARFADSLTLHRRLKRDGVMDTPSFLDSKTTVLQMVCETAACNVCAVLQCSCTCMHHTSTTPSDPICLVQFHAHAHAHAQSNTQTH